MLRWMKFLLWLNVLAAIYNFAAMSFLPPHNPLSFIHLVQLGIQPLNWIAAALMANCIEMKKEYDALRL